MEKVFAESFAKLLQKDDTIKTAVKSLIHTVDREAIKAFLTRFGFLVWSAVIFVLGVVATVLIEKALGK